MGRDGSSGLDRDGAQPNQTRAPGRPPTSVGELLDLKDTCSAECLVEWYSDDDTRRAVWDKFANGPAPVGYDPFIVPVWSEGPTAEQFAVLRLTPYRLRVMPSTVMTKGEGEVLSWHA